MNRRTLFDLLGIPKVIRKGRGKAPKMQSKVYAMLLLGKRSVGDISAALHIADPRGHIRDLRAKGINIVDDWCTGEDGVRYKHYWVAKEETV